jgi:galactokinase
VYSIDPSGLVEKHFGPGAKADIVCVPGRVNLIGEHIDYHNLPVLPMAVERRVWIAFRPRNDSRIRAASAEFGVREFDWTEHLDPSPSGDWGNYLKAAAQAVYGRWRVHRGIDAVVTSDLPAAAGLSSSSALLTGFVLALLRANAIGASFEELMDVLPEGEHFVGTRGGGMDHAAVLASRAGCALLVHFAPLSVEPVPIPEDWAFLVAHSLTTAEKSNELRAEYNARRVAGSRALEMLGFDSYAVALQRRPADELAAAAARLSGPERDCFLHVTEEAVRVRNAVAALRSGDAEEFGALLNASHDSLRDLLKVSNPALDELVDAARRAGAMGARLTGAGFGGCVVVFCKRSDRDRIAAELIDHYYSRRAGFNPAMHLIPAEPAAGALFG